MTTDVFVVGGVMGDDSPSGANNGWALTAGKLAAEAIAEQGIPFILELNRI